MTWTPVHIRATRRQLNLNQREFWGRLRVNQATASRYEAQERPLPVWLPQLLTIAYGSPKEAAKEFIRLRSSGPVTKRDRALSGK